MQLVMLTRVGSIMKILANHRAHPQSYLKVLTPDFLANFSLVLQGIAKFNSLSWDQRVLMVILSKVMEVFRGTPCLENDKKDNLNFMDPV